MWNLENKQIVYFQKKSYAKNPKLEKVIGWKFGMIYNLKVLIKSLIFCITRPYSFNPWKKQLFFSEGVYYFSRFSRLHNYIRGTDERLKKVFDTYGIENNIISSLGSKLIIDIGANIGEFSIALRERAKFTGRIICIEPDPLEFETLKKNAEIFNFFCINCAIASENKDGFISDDNFDANSRLLLESEDSRNGQAVKINTLNYALSKLKIQKIGLVKIEAEGFEPEVLKGIDFNSLDVEFFAIDCGPERPPYNSNTVVDCLNYLREFGYELESFDDQRISILMRKNECVR
jgi:FkbM family methyltransferase